MMLSSWSEINAQKMMAAVHFCYHLDGLSIAFDLKQELCVDKPSWETEIKLDPTLGFTSKILNQIMY
jgi:hypothetical protein